MSADLERQMVRLRELVEQCGIENKALRIYIEQLKAEIRRLKGENKTK